MTTRICYNRALMLFVTFQIVLSSLAALLLCLYVGWGAVRLGLPPGLRQYTALLVPLCGLALLMWAGYLGVSSWFSLRASLPLLLLGATVLNGLAWRRSGPPDLRGLHGEWLLLIVLLATWVTGIAPLLQYGYLTTIGRGWDPESYLPMAQYLVDYPVAQIGMAAVNPLRELVANPPGIGLTLGFSVLHGYTMLLSGQTALATFAPLLALLRSLGLLAIYIWFRTSMGLERTPATLAAACAGAGGLLLWIAFFNFGMQTASLPLIGAGLVLGLAAVDDLAARGWRAWPGGLLAGATLAALPVTYYPALTIFMPMAAGLGLALVVERWRAGRSVGPLAGAALALGLGTVILAAPTIRDYYAGFAFRYSLVAAKIGPDRFIPISDTLGLTVFRLDDLGSQPPTMLLLAGMAIILILALAALIGTPASAVAPAYRLRWLLVLAPLAGYLLWLRYGRPYEYAFMKSSAYLGPVLWGLLLFGWQRLRGWLPTRFRAVLVWLLVIPAIALLLSLGMLLRDHAAGPALFGRDLVGLAEPLQRVPPDAPVLISANEQFVGPNNGLLASMLYPRPIWGRVATAYASQSVWPEGATPHYAILAADEAPWPLDLGAQELWRSQALALYQFPSDLVFRLGTSAIYQHAPGHDQSSPAAMAAWRQAGPYDTLTPERPHYLELAESITFTTVPPAHAAPDQRWRVRLVLATAQPAQLRIQTGNTSAALTIPSGVSTAWFDAQALVQLESNMPVAVIAVGAQPAAQAAPALVEVQPGMVAWLLGVNQHGEQIDINMQLVNPGLHALRAEVTIVEDRYGAARRSLSVLAALPHNQAWQFQYVPGRGATQALVGGTPTALLQAKVEPTPADGVYVAFMTLYSGAMPVARLPLYRMELQAGAIAQFDVLANQIGVAQAGVPPTGTANRQQLLPNTLGFDNRPVLLNQVVLERKPAAPGAVFAEPFTPGTQLDVQLYWQAHTGGQPPLAVSLQLIGPDDRKVAQWDGPLGGWRQNQDWQAGEQIRQDVPLQIDSSAASGSYRLLLVSYDPATGVPQPVAGQQALLLTTLEIHAAP